jgi:hypothetical protein
VRYGRQKKSRKIEEEDRKITAYHEAGHAVVAALLPENDAPHKVTIVPRGRALGATMIVPERETYHLQRTKLHAQMTMLFGGRVAESLFCGDISAGASDDIRRATDLARAMVTELGMSEKVGPINYAERQGSDFLGTELGRGKIHSEETAREIDQEVMRFLNEAYQRAESMLRVHGREEIAKALLVYGTVTGEVSRIPAERRRLPPEPGSGERALRTARPSGAPARTTPRQGPPAAGPVAGRAGTPPPAQATVGRRTERARALACALEGGPGARLPAAPDDERAPSCSLPPPCRWRARDLGGASSPPPEARAALLEPARPPRARRALPRGAAWPRMGAATSPPRPPRVMGILTTPDSFPTAATGSTPGAPSGTAGPVEGAGSWTGGESSRPGAQAACRGRRARSARVAALARDGARRSDRHHQGRWRERPSTPERASSTT